MPGRVNIKFVVLLVVLLLCIAGAAVGVVAYNTHRDPTEFVKRGDALMKSGDYAKAADQYQHALNRKPGTVEYMLKLADAQSQIEYTSIKSARGQLSTQISTYASVSQLDPSNTEAQQATFSLYQTLGEAGDNGAWEVMLKQAKTALDRNTGMTIARKYRGIALVNRMRTIELSDADRATLQLDLRAALKETPDDLDTLRYLAVGDVFEAKILGRPGGNALKAEQLRKEARKLMADSAAAHPDDIGRKLDYLRVVMALDDKKEATRILGELETALLANPTPPLRVAEVVQLIMELNGGNTPTPDAVARGEALVRAGIKANPDDPRLQVVLAQFLSAKNPPTEALDLYRKVAAAPIHGKAIDVLRAANVVSIAQLRLTDLLLNQAERATSEAERKPAVDEAARVMEQVTLASTGRTPLMNLLDGRLKLLKGDPRGALKVLDAATAGTNDSVPDTFLYSARASAQVGEWGAAIQRLTRLSELLPKYMPARYELAQIHVRLNQSAEALKDLEVPLKANPDDKTALMLKVGALTQAARYDEAIALCNRMKPGENTDVGVTLAQVYSAKKEPDKARAVLQEIFEKHPEDLRVIVPLLSLVKDKSEKIQIIEKAKQAGVSSQMTDMLGLQTVESKEAVDSVRKILEEEKDPLARHLKLSDFYRQIGEQQKAEDELAEAAKVNKDHPAVVQGLFNQALTKRKFDQAEALAGQAAKLNLDQANGKFFYARLQMAQGQFEQALASINEGLTAQPVYSVGWRLKGDALRARGDFPGALQAYQKSLEQLPGNPDALRGVAASQDGMGKFPEALAAIRKAYELSPNDKGIAAQYLSYEQEHGDPQVAMKIRRQLAQSQPQDLYNRRILALLLARNKQAEEALQTADDLVKANPDSLPDVATAAAVRQLIGKGEEGRAVIKDYIDRRGKNATAEDWGTLAQYLLEEGNEDAAMASYKQALELEDPVRRQISREMADIFFSRGQYDKAAETYQKIMADGRKDRLVAMRDAEALVRSSQFDAADKVLTKVESDFEANETTMLLRALVARGRGDSAKAMDLLNSAIEKDPNRAIAYLERAITESPDPEKASEVVADLKKATELAPNNPMIRLMLAEMLARTANMDEAQRQLQFVLDREPRNRQARLALANVYAMNKSATALEQLLDESAKMFPQDAAWPQWQARAAMMGAKPDADRAYQKLREVYKLAPTPGSLVDLSQFLLDQKRADIALEVLRDKPDWLEQHPLLRALQGRAMWMLKQFDASKAVFTKAVEKSTDSSQVVRVAFQMKVAMGSEQSIALLQTLAVGPRATWVEMSMAQIELGGARFAAAASRLKRLEPRVAAGDDKDIKAGFYRMLSTAQYQARDFENAVTSYQAVLKIAPQDAEAMNNLAYLLAEDLNRPKDALPLAQQAAKAMPNVPLVLDTLGWTQHRTGDDDSAYDTLRRSVAKGGLPANTYHLAEVALAKGHKPEAKTLFESAKTLAEQAREKTIAEKCEKRLQELSL